MKKTIGNDIAFVGEDVQPAVLKELTKRGIETWLISNKNWEATSEQINLLRKQNYKVKHSISFTDFSRTPDNRDFWYSLKDRFARNGKQLEKRAVWCIGVQGLDEQLAKNVGVRAVEQDGNQASNLARHLQAYHCN